MLFQPVQCICLYLKLPLFFPAPGDAGGPGVVHGAGLHPQHSRRRAGEGAKAEGPQGQSSTAAQDRRLAGEKAPDTVLVDEQHVVNLTMGLEIVLVDRLGG